MVSSEWAEQLCVLANAKDGGLVRDLYHYYIAAFCKYSTFFFPQKMLVLDLFDVHKVLGADFTTEIDPVFPKSLLAAVLYLCLLYINLRWFKKNQ